MSEIFSGGRKSGQENEIVNLIVAEIGINTDQPALARLLEHALGVDTGAIIPNLDNDTAAAVLRRKPDRSFL